MRVMGEAIEAVPMAGVTGLPVDHTDVGEEEVGGTVKEIMVEIVCRIIVQGLGLELQKLQIKLRLSSPPLMLSRWNLVRQREPELFYGGQE